MATVAANIPDDLANELKAIAYRRRTTPSKIIRALVEREVKADKQNEL